MSEEKPINRLEWNKQILGEFMKSFIFKFLALSFLLVSSAFAMDAASLEMLKSMDIDKGQVSSMLEQLQKMGQITPEQAAKAKAELNSISDAEFSKYKEVAIKKVQSGDADRIMKHDFTKGTPKLEASLVEKTHATTETKRVPASVKKEAPAVIDFTKLGQ